MRNIKLVIFDLDGTLVDAYEAIRASFNYTMRALGYPLQKPGVIRRAVGWGDKNLLSPFIRKQDLAGALSIYRRHHACALVKKSKLLPGAEKIVAYLRRKGYFLAIASNRPTRFSSILMRHLGLKNYFDYMLCADKLKNGKPHPEIIRRIMKALKAPASGTIYVGDMVIDAQAGCRAGVKTFIVTTGSSHTKEIKAAKPFKVIRSIAALGKIL